MPELEASPIPEQNLKSKLLTLPKDTPKLISLNPSLTTTIFKWNIDGSIKTTANVTSQNVTISTSDVKYNNDLLGYTITYDPTYFTIQDSSIPGFDIGIGGRTSTIGDSNSLTSIVVRNSFKITEKAISSVQAQGLQTIAGSASKTSLIYIDANEIGGRSTVTVNLSL
jgi:hypothetical protein